MNIRKLHKLIQQEFAIDVDNWQFGDCLPFARALNKMLNRNNIKNEIVYAGDSHCAVRINDCLFDSYGKMTERKIKQWIRQVRFNWSVDKENNPGQKPFPFRFASKKELPYWPWHRQYYTEINGKHFEKIAAKRFAKIEKTLFGEKND